MKQLFLLAGAAALGLAGPALAKPGDGHGHGHGYQNDYGYGEAGCPPGLAKKHNGCLPPGQAKKWAIGRPLPREVVFYELPPPLVVQLGPPPGGYRYVRVANDVLLIALGSGMVIDAVADLGRM